MYLYVVASTQISKITHRFLETGHSVNEADSMHSLIDRTCSNVPVYTLHQYKQLIEGAKVDGKPYDIMEVAAEMIFDFKELLKSMANKRISLKRDANNNTIKWSKIKQVEIIERDNISMNIKYTHDPNIEATKIKLRGNEENLSATIGALPLSTAYEGPRKKFCRKIA